MVATLAERKLSVSDLIRMTEYGILSQEERIELENGRIVQMPPIGPEHNDLVIEMGWQIPRSLSEEYRVPVQCAIQLTEHRMRQPDLAVVRAGSYRDRLPGPADVLVVIEVSDTTIEYDRRVKLLEYAQAGIPEAWILDVVGRTLERYTDPTPQGYTYLERSQQLLASSIIPELILDARTLFGTAS